MLYWPTANRRGFIAGLLVGIAIWLATTLLPLLFNLQGIYLPILDIVYVLDDSSWHLAAIASLAANILVFTLVSLFTEASSEEVSAAEACAVDNVSRPQRRELLAHSPQDFATQLSKPLGAITAQKEVEQALRDLHLPFDERRPYALRRLRDRLEANQLSPDEFRALAGETREFLGGVVNDTRETNAQLLEIMMAQDFQDLTGQVIKKVVDLAQSLEQQLLQVLLEAMPAERKR